MTGIDSTCLIPLYQIIPEREVSNDQKDMAIMYALGMSFEDIAARKQIKPITVRKHIDIVKEVFGEVSLSNVRTIIFLRLLVSFSTGMTMDRVIGNLEIVNKG